MEQSVLFASCRAATVRPCGARTRDRLPHRDGLAHAFVADSGEAMESLFLGERKGNDVILSS